MNILEGIQGLITSRCLITKGALYTIFINKLHNELLLSVITAITQSPRMDWHQRAQYQLIKNKLMDYSSSEVYRLNERYGGGQYVTGYSSLAAEFLALINPYQPK